MALLAKTSAAGLPEEAERLAPIVAGMRPESRLPLVDLALPALRRLSDAQFRAFRANIDPLIRADGRVSLFEFALQHMLLRHLDRQFRRTPPVASHYPTLAPLTQHVSALLSSLAWIGQDGPDEVRFAFDAGAARLGAESSSVTLFDRPQSSLSSVESALNVLATATPPAKRRVLEACAATISADGRVTPSEGELLRAIADSLDCPMPPLLANRG